MPLSKRIVTTVTLAVLAIAPVAQASANSSTGSATTTAPTSKSVNLYVNPIGLIFGSANVAAEFPVTRRFTVGPSLSYSRISSTTGRTTTTASSFGIGARGVFYLTNDAFDTADSWFFMPFFEYTNASANNLSVSGLAMGGNLGYWWHFDGGFNLSLGFGAQYMSLDFTKIGLASVSAILPSAQFTLGFAL